MQALNQVLNGKNLWKLPPKNGIPKLRHACGIPEYTEFRGKVVKFRKIEITIMMTKI